MKHDGVEYLFTLRSGQADEEVRAGVELIRAAAAEAVGALVRRGSEPGFAAAVCEVMRPSGLLTQFAREAGGVASQITADVDAPGVM